MSVVSDDVFWTTLRASEDRSDLLAAARPGYYIERKRVIPILERWLESHQADHPPDDACHNKDKYPTSALTQITGVSERQIRGILRGETSVRMKLRGGSNGGRYPACEGGVKYLTLDMVDRLFTGMGLVHLFYIPPEAGGFSDVYFHSSVIDAP